MKLDISHVAKLANLPLNEDEHEKFEEQLSSVLNYVEKLNKVDTENVAETSQVTGLENILREDEAGESLPQATALSQAKHTHNALFAVKGIFENE